MTSRPVLTWCRDDFIIRAACHPAGMFIMRRVLLSGARPQLYEELSTFAKSFRQHPDVDCPHLTCGRLVEPAQRCRRPVWLERERLLSSGARPAGRSASRIGSTSAR